MYKFYDLHVYQEIKLVTNNLQLSKQLNSIKASVASKHVRWLTVSKPTFRETSLFSLSENWIIDIRAIHFPYDNNRGGSQNIYPPFNQLTCLLARESFIETRFTAIWQCMQQTNQSTNQPKRRVLFKVQVNVLWSV